MRKMMLLAILACGCAHQRGGVWTGTDAIIVASVIAVEIATAEPAPSQAPLCSDDVTDPPHVCPGTTPAPPEP